MTDKKQATDSAVAFTLPTGTRVTASQEQADRMQGKGRSAAPAGTEAETETGAEGDSATTDEAPKTRPARKNT